MKTEIEKGPKKENQVAVAIHVRTNVDEVLARIDRLKTELEKANTELTELASQGITLEIDV